VTFGREPRSVFAVKVLQPGVSLIERIRKVSGSQSGLTEAQAFTIENDDLLARFQEFVSNGETGDSRADHTGMATYVSDERLKQRLVAALP
jgi:hypothetical protein